MRTHETEHPECLIDVKLPKGFVDESWENDAYPHFVNKKLGLDIWINYKDKYMREEPRDMRFTLYHWREGCTVQRLFKESDDWKDILLATVHLNIEQYKVCITDCHKAEEVVEVMNAFSERFYTLRVLNNSYDEVALDLANIQKLFIFAGHHWLNLTEKEV